MASAARNAVPQRPSARDIVPASLRRLRWANVFKRLSQFLLLIHPAVSLRMMRVFVCLEIEGEWWLAADLSLPCFDQRWTMHALVAAVIIALFTFGLPLTIFCWLRANRHSLREAETLDKLGHLYEQYGDTSGVYLWETQEVMRKLLLTSAVLLFDAGSPMQLTSALLLSACAWTAHTAWKPYVDRKAYLLQSLALGITVVIFTAALLFKLDAFEVADATEPNSLANEAAAAASQWLGAVIAALIAGFVACLLLVGSAHVLGEVARHVCTLRRRRQRAR